MFQTNETCEALKECYLISQREISPLVVIFKKNRSALMEDYSTQLQTYTSNRVHIIQILSAAPSFMGV